MSDAARLFDDLHEFTARYVGWTDEFRVGAVGFVMASHIYTQFQSFPYLQFTGPTGSGKTTSVEMMYGTCYNPIVFQAITPAVLFRMAHEGHTLIIDEQNVRPTGTTLDVLRSGFGRSGKVIRCGSERSGWKPERFNSFCPKILAGQHPLDDAALQSRMITENMALVPQRDNRWPPELPPSFAKEVPELRDRLTAWAKASAEIDHSSVRMPDEMSSRTQQVFLPLFVVTPDKYRPQLEVLVQRHIDSVSREISDTPDAVAVTAVLDMGSPSRFRPGDLADTVNKTAGITSTHRDAMTAKMAGIVLRRLGFRFAGRNKRGSWFEAAPGQIETLARSMNLKPTDDDPDDDQGKVPF